MSLLKKVCVLLLILLSSHAFCNEAKQLEKQLTKATTDSVRARLYNELSVIYNRSGAFDLARNVAFKALTLAKLNSCKQASRAYRNIGLVYYQETKYDSARYFLHKALKHNETCPDQTIEANIYLSIGQCYYYEANYTQALAFCYKSIDIAHLAKDKKAIILADLFLADILIIQDEENLALRKAFAAMLYAKEINDTQALAHCYNIVANVFSKKKLYKSSISYFLKVINIVEAREQWLNVAYMELGVAECYFTDKQTDLAIKYANKARYAIITYTRDTFALASLYALYANIYLTKKQYDSSLVCTNLALNFAKKSINQQCLKESYFIKAQLYKHFKNVDSLFYYQTKYQNITDSIYSIQKKQLEDIQYQRQKEITRQLNETKLQHEKTTKQAALSAIVLLVFLGIILYRSYHLKKRDNLLLTKQKQAISIQKEIIENKNKEIKQSIDYAKYIQTSIQPAINLKDSFADSFLLYKPKDIVSGDFYWLEEADGLFYIAIADCTGHGVPGAFMSMMGTTLLNEIYNQHSFKTAADILTKLNYLIKVTFKQHIKESIIHDGMDISICIINKQEKTLQYAGAYRPIWIMNGNDFIELRPDKTAIGGITPINYEYHNQNYLLKKGDHIYLFTDGYADQFGGAKNKKITTKRFRDKLTSIHTLNAEAQQQELDNYFKTWKGNNEQVDDITIVGIKI